jgi:hypothetical protein
LTSDKGKEKNSIKERKSFQEILLGNWIDTCERMKLVLFLRKYRKINSKCIAALNLRAKTIKLLEENIGRKLPNLAFGNCFLDMTCKYIKEIVDKIVDKLDFIKIENIYISEDIIQTVKQKCAEWEEILANHIFYKAFKF